MTHEEAAAVPDTACTALTGLKEKVSIRPTISDWHPVDDFCDRNFDFLITKGIRNIILWYLKYKLQKNLFPLMSLWELVVLELKYIKKLKYGNKIGKRNSKVV